MSAEVNEVVENIENETAENEASLGGLTTVKAKATKEDKTTVSGEISINFGETMDDLAKFCGGAENVRQFAIRALVIKAQAAMRAELVGGTSPEDLQAKFANWNPNAKVSIPKDEKKAAAQMFAKLSPEQQQEILKSLGFNLG